MHELSCQRGVKLNKRSLSLLLLFALLLLSTVALSIANLKAAYAQESSSSSIDVKVNHLIIVHDGGLVTISDKVTLSKTGEPAPSLRDFRIGFPYGYKSSIYNVFAYESNNPEKKLALDLDYGLGQIGFYAVRVNFGKDINLNEAESYSFTVVFVLSNLITESQEETQFLFKLDFPAHPSLAENASSCKTTLILPSNANFTESSLPFNQTATGVLTLVKEPLDAFALKQGTVSFTAIGAFYLLEADEVKREVVLDEWEELLVSDTYRVTNKAIEGTANITVSLPQDAEDVSAQDDLENKLTVNLVKNAKTTASITLKTAIKQNETDVVEITFRLPWKNHVDQNGWNNFNLKFRLFESVNLTLRKLTVTINLPEGAEFQSSNTATQPNAEESGAYQEKPVFTLNNVTSFQNLDFTITYTYSVFWASFRPTMWTGALVLIIGAVAFLWQIQRVPAPVPTALPIRPEELQNYVRTYEEERKILQEREALEVQARKGKIPRRLYRVRSRTLESRLSVLSRELAALREKIRVAGPRYSEMMRQIEVAETELQGVEADIRRTESRYRRGEISAAAYHKLLEDSYRRRDRAKTNIDGVLLRLREEIS